MKRIILAVMLVALSCYILGCGNHSDEQNQDITGVVETEELATEQTTEVVDEVQVEEAEVVITPTKEEVLAMRAIVLTGMSEEEIKRLKENIKIANLQMEEAYLYDDLFARLEDKEEGSVVAATRDEVKILKAAKPTREEENLEIDEEM